MHHYSAALTNVLATFWQFSANRFASDFATSKQVLQRRATHELAGNNVATVMLVADHQWSRWLVEQQARWWSCQYRTCSMHVLATPSCGVVPALKRHADYICRISRANKHRCMNSACLRSLARRRPAIDSKTKFEIVNNTCISHIQSINYDVDYPFCWPLPCLQRISSRLWLPAVRVLLYLS